MDVQYCKCCCEYDSPKGSSTGYCCRMPQGQGGVVGDETCKCGHFVPGQFKDRIRLRKEHEEQMKALASVFK